MDWTQIITGFIAAVASIFGSWCVMNKKSKEDAVNEAIREQKQADRLEAIEHKLDIHNGYAEKLGSMSEDMAVMKRDIQYLKEK